MTAVSPLHPEAGRDSWFPHSQIQTLRERIEVLESERDQRENEAAHAFEALTVALHMCNQHEERLKKLEARR